MNYNRQYDGGHHPPNGWSPPHYGQQQQYHNQQQCNQQGYYYPSPQYQYTNQASNETILYMQHLQYQLQCTRQQHDQLSRQHDKLSQQQRCEMDMLWKQVQHLAGMNTLLNSRLNNVAKDDTTTLPPVVDTTESNVPTVIDELPVPTTNNVPVIPEADASPEVESTEEDVEAVEVAEVADISEDFEAAKEHEDLLLDTSNYFDALSNCDDDSVEEEALVEDKELVVKDNVQPEVIEQQITDGDNKGSKERKKNKRSKGRKRNKGKGDTATTVSICVYLILYPDINICTYSYTIYHTTNSFVCISRV